MTAPFKPVDRGSIITRTFSGRASLPLVSFEGASSAEGQAALRQFTVERLTAYGVDHSDAVELRGRVLAGESWQSAATLLAEDCLAPADAVSESSTATRTNRLYRASALVRMSQMMMLADSDERAAIVARSADLYGQAAAITADREKLRIDTVGGPLVAWRFPSKPSDCVGRALIIGGVEGWAMDFSEMGIALAARGVEAFVLDGPGQGESRMLHRHYLTWQWQNAYSDVFDFIGSQPSIRPLAFIGNSMGGAVAMHLAARDPRIAACCSNGGPKAPGRPPSNPTFFRKMMAHCGQVSEEVAEEVWSSIQPLAAGHPIRVPLLVLQGGHDPLVSNVEAEALVKHAASVDKSLVVYSDGDHCVYNHSDDKHNLIGDWVADRLANGECR